MDPGDLDSISKSSPTALRSLIWEGSIPICFILETGELPNGSDRSVEAFYTSVPRLSYLSLLVPLVLSNLIKLCLDEASLISLKSENIWFEHGASKTPLRWHWPVGLIYDVLVASLPSSSTSLPLQVIVHLHPPPAEKILLPNTIAACRDAFMNQQVKEADFVRSGSTKRVTNLRQREAESLWEGLVEHDFDKFWLVASKLIPTPPAIRNSSSAPITLNQSSTTGDKMPDGNGIRRVPLRVYLPDQAPVLQSNSGPVDPDGRPATLGLVLKGLIPLLFPEPITNSKRRLARAFIQGTQVPLETELGWLGTVMCCADGWVPVVIHLGR